MVHVNPPPRGGEGPRPSGRPLGGLLEALGVLKFWAGKFENPNGASGGRPEEFSGVPDTFRGAAGGLGWVSQG